MNTPKITIREPESDNPSPSDGLLKMNTPTKVQALIMATLKLGGMSDIKSKQAAAILSKYLRLK